LSYSSSANKFVAPEGVLKDIVIKGNTITVSTKDGKEFTYKFRHVDIRVRRIMTRFHKVYSILVLIFFILFVLFIVLIVFLYPYSPEETATMVMIFLPIFTLAMITVATLTHTYFNRPLPLLRVIDKDGVEHYFVIPFRSVPKIAEIIEKYKSK